MVAVPSEGTTRNPIRIVSFVGDGAEWDEFVRRAETSTFCHLLGWREIITDVFGHRCPYVLALDESGARTGVLPLVHVKSRLLGNYLVSMPFLNYGGPIGSSQAMTALARAATEEAQRAKVDLLELRGRHAVDADLRISHRKITVTLDMPPTVEALWSKGIPPSRRRQIKRAQKEGMEFRLGQDQLEPFYEVFARNMRDLGTPVLPRRWFERIAQVFPDIVFFGAIYYRNQPVAGGCGFLWRDEFELSWVSSVHEYNPMMPTMLLYWSFMEHLVARDVRVFNFGRCTPGGRTHQFKLQWGGVDVPLPWAQWSPHHVTSTPSDDRPLLRFAAAVWRHVPLAVANWAGPKLARSLPF